MIKSFANATTAALFEGKRIRKMDAGLAKRAQARLVMIDQAVRIEDLRVPPSNRLETLKGDRKGQWSIRANRQYRICFRWEDGNAHDVEFVDYH